MRFSMQTQMSSSSRLPALNDHMEQAYYARNALYRDIRVFARMPDIHLIQEPVWVGIFSWSLQKTKARWLKGNTLVNMGFGVQTPTDVVRDYLAWKHPKKLKACGSQARAITAHRSTPLYLKPGVLTDGVYVDIKSAYFSLVNLVGWDVDYFPGKWVVPGQPCYDFPLANDTRRIGKAARACLVSIGLSHTATKWSGSEFYAVKTQNRLRNYGLWSIAQDILHAIAEKAVALGAIYAHTDGYILPNGAADLLQEYISDWGLGSGRKGQGPTMVLGFGNFICGEFKTKRLRPISGKPYRGVYSVDGKWLQSQLSRRIKMTP